MDLGHTEKLHLFMHLLLCERLGFQLRQVNKEDKPKSTAKVEPSPSGDRDSLLSDIKKGGIMNFKEIHWFLIKHKILLI